MWAAFIKHHKSNKSNSTAAMAGTDSSSENQDIGDAYGDIDDDGTVAWPWCWRSLVAVGALPLLLLPLLLAVPTASLEQPEIFVTWGIYEDST